MSANATQPTKQFLSAAEVAALLNVSADCIRAWARERVADFPRPSIQVKGAMRWRRVRVEAWIEGMERDGGRR